MASTTARRTGKARAKPATPSPFDLGDRTAEWLNRLGRKTQRAVRKFEQASAIAFWAAVLGYATAKGWIL